MNASARSLLYLYAMVCGLCSCSGWKCKVGLSTRYVCCLGSSDESFTTASCKVDEDAYGGMIPMYVIERGGNIILDPWMLPPLIPILPPGTWSDSSSDDADTDARIHDIEDVD